MTVQRLDRAVQLGGGLCGGLEPVRWGLARFARPHNVALDTAVLAMLAEPHNLDEISPAAVMRGDKRRKLGPSSCLAFRAIGSLGHARRLQRRLDQALARGSTACELGRSICHSTSAFCKNI